VLVWLKLVKLVVSIDALPVAVCADGNVLIGGLHAAPSVGNCYWQT
jgi:hypothetical protein